MLRRVGWFSFILYIFIPIFVSDPAMDTDTSVLVTHSEDASSVTVCDTFTSFDGSKDTEGTLATSTLSVFKQSTLLSALTTPFQDLLDSSVNTKNPGELQHFGS